MESSERTELARLQAQVETLMLQTNRNATLSRQLDAVRNQLRRAEESLERRDVILREARGRIAALTREVEAARAEARVARDELASVVGTRWWKMRRRLERVAGRKPAPKAKPVVSDAEPWQPAPVPASPPRAERLVRELRVAAIVGRELRNALEPECTLVTFGPARWQEALEDAAPHFLLVESDEYGNDSGWQACLAAEPSEPALRDMLDWCRRREIPTIFWNTRDPVELERWLPIAALFDHVATVDEGCVARYAGRGALALRGISYVPHGVQPRMFNPASAGRLQKAFFLIEPEHVADGWSRKAVEDLLAAVPDADVFTAGELDVPAIASSRARMLSEPRSSLYRRYAVALSAAAHGDANGKISLRVLQMLASGAAVVAVDSPDAALLLGQAVRAVDAAHAGEAVSKALTDAGSGVRHVLRAHTVAHRLAMLATEAGVLADAEAGRRAAALVIADDAGEVPGITERLLAQSRAPDEILIGTKARRADVSGGTVRIVEQDNSGDRIRELAALASAPWVVVVEGAIPGRHALEDLVLAAPYADADVIGYGVDMWRHGGMVDASVVLIRRDVVAERGWPADADDRSRMIAEGLRVFSVGPLR